MQALSWWKTWKSTGRLRWFCGICKLPFLQALNSSQANVKIQKTDWRRDKEKSKGKEIIGNISIVFCHVTFSKSLGLSTVPFHPGPAGV